MSGSVRLPFEVVFSPRLGRVKWPRISAMIIGPKASLRAQFLLDSGADVSLIPRSMGQDIGLSIKGAVKCEGRAVGGAFVPYYLCSVQVQIGDLRIPIRVGWSMIDQTRPILGRLDVFELLDIDFRQHTNVMLLRPASNQA